MNRRDALKQTALLLGYAVSASTVAAVMNGCKAEPNASDLGNWEPKFLSKDMGRFIAEVGETIIPRTDKPGAIDAGVHSFIDQMLLNTVPAEEQEMYRSAVKSLADNCAEQMGKSFVDCNGEERKRFLEGVEKAANDASDENDPMAQVWFPLKEAVLTGYFTSEVGMKEALVYDPIPGDYLGCIPLSDVGGTWAH